MTSLPVQERKALILPVSLFNQSWWIIASALGVLIGPVLNDWVPHLDFAIVCLFAILAYEQYRLINSSRPIIVGTVALIIASFFSTDWLLIIAIFISILMILTPTMLSHFSNSSAKGER